MEKRKLIDSNKNVSLGGRADKFAKEFYFQPKTGTKKRVIPNSVKDPVEYIVKMYKLRGIEFGNWLSTPERYDLLNALLYSLNDMKKYLKINNIGFNEKIGIALGARGNGGNVRAHYEPIYNMINLTKTMGAGSLAHEYGHAIDYNFGAYVDQSIKSVSLTGGMSTNKNLTFSNAGELRKVANEIVNDVYKLNYSRIDGEIDGYWFRRTEVFARYFEQLVCYVLHQKKVYNKYLTKSWLYYIKARNYLTEESFKKILPKGKILLQVLQKYLK